MNAYTQLNTCNRKYKNKKSSTYIFNNKYGISIKQEVYLHMAIRKKKYLRKIYTHFVNSETYFNCKQENVSLIKETCIKFYL